MNNLDFFNISLLNTKINYDFSSPAGKVVIPKTKEETNDLIEANHNLIDLITTYKTLQKCSPNSGELTAIVNEIIKLLDSTKYINYTSFCVYFQVLRYSYNTYFHAKNLSPVEKFNLIKTTVELYIKNRHSLYLEHGYSDQVLQVMCDASSSRRNGNTGTKNLSSIMALFNIQRVNSFDEFKTGFSSYILPDKGDSNILKEIIKHYKIDFAFKKTRENKNPDMAFKLGSDLYIMEHKLTNGGGGSQNMEINEIISFIGHKESNLNTHYISCLQGDYFGKLDQNNKEPKANAQYENIKRNLKKNSRNYFVNEFGLIELLKAQSSLYANH